MTERLEARFEGGVFKLYDRTRAASDDLSIERKNSSAICGAIFSIVYQAIENIKQNEQSERIKEQIIGKLKLAIEGPLNTDPKNAVFLRNLMLAYADSIGTLKIEWFQELDFDTLEEQFMKAFMGFEENIIKQYLGETFEEVVFRNDPESFIIDMVTQFHAMIKEGALSEITANSEILFPISASNHTFILRPDMTMLQDVMGNPDSAEIKKWIENNVNGKNAFIVADLNWVSYGEHLFLAIKRNEDGELVFVCINEHGKETDLPKSDSNHNFGDEGFRGLFTWLKAS